MYIHNHRIDVVAEGPGYIETFVKIFFRNFSDCIKWFLDLNREKN